MYLQDNQRYWERGYTAPNVDSSLFRFYGRILKHDFPHLRGSRLVDFGCGQGASVNFLHQVGFDVIGVDSSSTDIEAGRILFPHVANRLELCDIDPNKVPYYGYSENVAVVTAVQSLYYLNDEHFDACIRKIASAMVPGGVFYATMMGTRCAEFYDNSVDAGGGLRKVEFANDRVQVSDYYMSFIEDEAHLKRKFHLFRPLHIGYYAARFRNDEGDGFHYTFCGIKE